MAPEVQPILQSLGPHEDGKIKFESGPPERRSALIFLSQLKYYPLGLLDEAIYVLIVYELNFFSAFLEHSQESIIGEGW